MFYDYQIKCQQLLAHPVSCLYTTSTAGAQLCAITASRLLTPFYVMYKLKNQNLNYI